MTKSLGSLGKQTAALPGTMKKDYSKVNYENRTGRKIEST